MKEKTYLLLALVLAAPLAHAEVSIYQVLYDPVGTESGGEAIELRNLGPSPADISGWTIATDSSNTDATIPQNKLLASGATFLIADEGWNQSKDNPDWKQADHAETITLGNRDGGVALLSNGTVVDAVSWGNASNIDTILLKGTPAKPVMPGKSLRRMRLSGDSIEDFEEAPADFYEGIPIALTADVTITVPIIEVSPFIDLAPEGELSIRNNGENTVRVKLRATGLSYKNYTLPPEAVSIDGPVEVVIAPGTEYKTKLRLVVPPGTVPGKYASTLRVTVFDS